MLAFARRSNESFTIGDDIIVTILRCGLGRVTIGVSCPRDLSIDRLAESESFAWRLRKLQQGANWAAPTAKQIAAAERLELPPLDRRPFVRAGAGKGGAL